MIMWRSCARVRGTTQSNARVSALYLYFEAACLEVGGLRQRAASFVLYWAYGRIGGPSLVLPGEQNAKPDAGKPGS